jgi:signal transduction histidine kinase
MIGYFGMGAIAVFFYRAAQQEQMSGWKWAIASIIVSFVALEAVGFALAVIPAQLALYGVLWWQNSKRMERLPEERAAQAAADRAVRQERVRLAHEDADRRRAQEEADRKRPGA